MEPGEERAFNIQLSGGEPTVRDDLVTLASGRRIVLVRHGETQQHAEKMFIGQYDVQYRAVNALRKLLLENDSKDVVIVSHSAVIRALQNNLEGRSIDSNWNNLNKGEYIILEY